MTTFLTRIFTRPRAFCRLRLAIWIGVSVLTVAGYVAAWRWLA